MSNIITSTKDLLIILSAFVDSMNTSNSDLHKEKVFKKYADKYPDPKAPFLRSIILVNSDLIPFNVTSDSVIKFKQNIKKQAKRIKPNSYTDGTDGNLELFKLLTDLHLRNVSGDKGKQTIIATINKYPEYEKILLNIIDKDLKIRFTDKSINKIIPGLVPVFYVSLGEKYDKKTKKYVDKPYNNGWYLSRKLDGVRCICKVLFDAQSTQPIQKVLQTETKGSINKFFKQKDVSPIRIEFYSRQGRQFKTLSKLETDIKEHMSELINEIIAKDSSSKGFVLDGEVCSIDDDGLENFQGMMKEINKKNHTMENPKYLLFDMLTLEEFDSCTSDRVLSSRSKQLNELIDRAKCTRLSCIQQVPYDEKTLKRMEEQVAKHGWEGLILRKNAKYIGDRSKDLLKVKKFHREEYKVKSIETTFMRTISKKTGLEEEIETLKAVVISHKNCDVSVGSGFTISERKQFFKDPSQIIGKIISVQFFEETKDKEGDYSLRFPTFKGLYGDKREF